MTTIRKVLITAFGDESNLAIVTAELPDPGPREAQLQIEYSIVAGSDVNMRRGTYPFQRKAPLTPGYSVIGTILFNGPGASQYQPGTRVAALAKYDGQAERINLPEKFLVPVPAGVDLEQAVAVPLDWVTAYQMLHRSARIRAGQRIFVHGLTGGVGAALLRLGLVAGAEVFGTASAGKHAELQALGAVPFDYKTKIWIGEVQQRGGVDAVFDPLGYESFDESYSILRSGGILVGYGFNLPALQKRPRSPVLPVMLKLFARNLLFWRRRRTTFYGLTRTSKFYKPDLERLFTWLAEGRITVPIKAVFSLDAIQDAHREYEKSTGAGSIILAIRP